ncbi:MAG: hypothetical protein ACYTF0_05575, partial [Planctomycetota bacterium]
MAQPRHIMLGPPHTYYVSATCIDSRACFANGDERAAFAGLIDTLSAVFNLRCFALAFDDNRYHLILRHQAENNESEQALRARWQPLATRSTPHVDHLRQRLT